MTLFGLAEDAPTKAAAAALLLQSKVAACTEDSPVKPSISPPDRVDLVGICLDREEGTLDPLTRLGILDDAVGQAHGAVDARPPQRPRLFALTARDGALLWAVLVAEGAAASGHDHVGVAQVLEEGRQSLGSHVAFTRKAEFSESGPNWARTYLPRAMISAGAIGGDIRGEDLRDTGHLDGRTHCPHDLRGDLAHLAAEGHGVVEAAGTLDTGELGVHEGRVAALQLWA